MSITNISEEFEGVKELFINYCYRDIADKDYLTARLCYRNGLIENFLWASLQCIEKYIKAILLFNDRSTKSIGHNLKKGMDEIYKIKGIKWDFDEEYIYFVEKYLNYYGKIRYFEEPIRIPFPLKQYNEWTKFKNQDSVTEYLNFLQSRNYKNTNMLNQLDNSVWQIRRYCLNLPSMKINENYRYIKYLEFIHSKDTKKNPHKLKHFGFIREVIEMGRYKNLKKVLIWRNKYFSTRNRKDGGLIIKDFENMPPHLRYTEFMKQDWFKNNVKYSNYFKENVRNELGIEI